jgi:hypothetical protein
MRERLQPHLQPDVASAGCFSGNCKVLSCVPGSYDLDFACANGCECAGGPGGSSCATSMDLGSLAPGAQTSYTLQLEN